MNIYKRNTAESIDVIAYTYNGRKFCDIRRGYNVRRAKLLCKKAGVLFESIQRQKV